MDWFEKHVKQEHFPSTDHRQLPSSLQRLSPPTPSASPLLRRLTDRGGGWVGTRTRDFHRFISRRCQEDGAEGLLRRPDAAGARRQKVGSGGRGDENMDFFVEVSGESICLSLFFLNRWMAKVGRPR